MENVGELIGLDGIGITSNNFLFVSSVSLPGELNIFNGGGLTTQTLGANQQGVYTCRIPDERGAVVSVNIGVYPIGFISE